MYKRQTLQDGDDDAASHHMTFGAGRFLGGGERPVSYTHLDVYKRQAVDTFAWGSANLRVEAGASFERTDLFGNNWVVAATPWSAAHADKGSPGAAFAGIILPTATPTPVVFPTPTPTPGPALRIRPVSYTHLDVYKRQAMDRAGRISRPDTRRCG